MTRMHFQTNQRKTIDIGDGLIMRWSTKADIANVSTLLADGFRRRMLSGKNAVMSEFDYALVEHIQRGEGKNPIVACMALHRHAAYYGSVNVYFGKPEFIVTDPEYRNRGLVGRLLREMLHPESEARGDAFQVIAGLYHYYRRFGYEYGLTLRPSAKIEDTNVVQPLAKGKSEPYTLRKATLDDLPFLKSMSTLEMLHTSAQVGTRYSEEYWRYTVHDIFEDKQSRYDGDRDTRIIVDAASGKDVGCTVVVCTSRVPELELMALDESQAAYVDVVEPVLRQLFDIAKANQVLRAEEKARAVKEVTATANDAAAEAATNTQSTVAVTSESSSDKLSFSVFLDEKHPLRQLLGAKVKSPAATDNGFRIYTRIKSYPIFIKIVAPELEKRLANSAMAGTTGRLRLDFFRQ
ncbi:hypothetical protein BGZ98_004772, partial [Dissophora globulifera]